MMDWLGKMLKLPEEFLAGNAGEGGGVIQVTEEVKFNTDFCSLDTTGIKRDLFVLPPLFLCRESKPDEEAAFLGTILG